MGTNIEDQTENNCEIRLLPVCTEMSGFCKHYQKTSTDDYWCSYAISIVGRREGVFGGEDFEITLCNCRRAQETAKVNDTYSDDDSKCYFVG